MFKWFFGRRRNGSSGAGGKRGSVAVDLSQVRVKDADTFAIGNESIRIVGYDAPEIDKAKSEHESRMWMAAAERLVELLNAPNEVRMERLPQPDHNGRTLAKVYINNRDLSDIAIEEGWGVPMPNRRRRPDEMPDWRKMRYPR
jgi:endonuclease YncB( thermonuclease family)